MISHLLRNPVSLSSRYEQNDTLQAQHAIANSRQTRPSVADSDQEIAQFIVGARHMCLPGELCKDGSRYGVQLRSDLFEQVGAQIDYLVDEHSERFDACGRSNVFGEFLCHGFERA